METKYTPVACLLPFPQEKGMELLSKIKLIMLKHVPNKNPLETAGLPKMREKRATTIPTKRAPQHIFLLKSLIVPNGKCNSRLFFSFFMLPLYFKNLPVCRICPTCNTKYYKYGHKYPFCMEPFV